jgi:hypothetical protein
VGKKGRQWSNLRGVVPEQDEKEPTERELKVREAIAEREAHEDEHGNPVPAKSLRELAAEYGDLCEEEEFEDLAAKQRSIKYEAVERIFREKLEAIYEQTGHDTFRGEGQLFSPKTKIFIDVHDKAKLRKHIDDLGMNELLELPSGRLNSLVIEQLEKFETMTVEERAECPYTPMEPVPGVRLFIKRTVHRTKS